MKWGKLLLGVGWACVLYACSDDDGKDDTIMNMSELTGKYWYYNAWLGDKYGMGQSDLLEVIRFEKGGVLKMMEFGGRRVHAIGTWTGGDNQITMDLDDGDSIVWNVQRSGPDYIQTIVNAQGERKYTTDPGYLGELTADAFLVNEYTDGNQFKTYIGVDVRGNKNVKEVQLWHGTGTIKKFGLDSDTGWKITGIFGVRDNPRAVIMSISAERNGKCVSICG